MMRRSLLILASLSVIGLVFACNQNAKEEPSNTNSRNESAQVTFLPSCGNPGSLVHIKVNTDSCETKTTSVQFSGGTGLGFENGAVVGGQSRDYTMNVTVPGNAKTGPVTIFGCGNLLDTKIESTSVFTIPCPPDAGAEAGSGVAPVGGGVKVGMNDHGGGAPRSYGGSGEFRLGTPEQLERLARFIENENAALGSIPVGTCANDPRSADRAEVDVKPVDAGPAIDLLRGSTVVTSLARNGGLSYSYPGEGSFPFGENLDVRIAGSSQVPGGTLTGAMPFARDIEITSPDISMNTNPYPAAGLALTWKPFEAQMAYVDFVLGATQGLVCRLDPKAGTLMVPAAAFEAAKAAPFPSILMEVHVEAENRVPITIAGEDRTFVLQSEVTKSFTFKK